VGTSHHSRPVIPWAPRLGLGGGPLFLREIRDGGADLVEVEIEAPPVTTSLHEGLSERLTKEMLGELARIASYESQIELKDISHVQVERVEEDRLALQVVSCDPEDQYCVAVEQSVEFLVHCSVTDENFASCVISNIEELATALPVDDAVVGEGCELEEGGVEEGEIAAPTIGIGIEEEMVTKRAMDEYARDRHASKTRVDGVLEELHADMLAEAVERMEGIMNKGFQYELKKLFSVHAAVPEKTVHHVTMRGLCSAGFELEGDVVAPGEEEDTVAKEIQFVTFETPCLSSSDLQEAIMHVTKLAFASKQ